MILALLYVGSSLQPPVLPGASSSPLPLLSVVRLWHRHLAGVVHILAIEVRHRPRWGSFVCIWLQPATGHMPATALKCIGWFSNGADRASGCVKLQMVRSLNIKEGLGASLSDDLWACRL